MYRLLQQQWPDWKWYRRASSAFIPSSSSTNCWSYPSSSMGVKLGHFWSKQEKGSRCLRINAWESSASNTSWDYKTNDYVCSKVKSVMVQYESLLAIIKCWNMSHGITTSARPSCKALLKVDTSGNGNAKAGHMTSVDGHDNAGTESQCQQILLEEVLFLLPLVPLLTTEAVKGPRHIYIYI